MLNGVMTLQEAAELLQIDLTVVKRKLQRHKEKLVEQGLASKSGDIWLITYAGVKELEKDGRRK